jgi:hypothetical protein
MSILVAVVSLLSLLSGFDLPLFKDGIQDRISQMDVCAGNSCYEGVPR